MNKLSRRALMIRANAAAKLVEQGVVDGEQALLMALLPSLEARRMSLTKARSEAAKRGWKTRRSRMRSDEG